MIVEPMNRIVRRLADQLRYTWGSLLGIGLLTGLLCQGCHTFSGNTASSETQHCSADEALSYVANARTPLTIRLAFDDRAVDPALASLFAHELASGLTGTQQFSVRIVPVGRGGPPGTTPPEPILVEDAGGLVLEAKIIEIRPYQPMLLRAEFELHDEWSMEPGVRLQGTWDAPTFPPNAATGPVRRWRAGRLPIQMLEEEVPLISTSPRMFARYIGGTIAQSLTDSWNARYTNSVSAE